MTQQERTYDNLSKNVQRLVSELDNRGEGVSYIQQWIDSQKNEKPSRLMKPKLNHSGDLLSIGAQIYLNECLAYDEAQLNYQLALEKYNVRHQEIYEALEFFVKDQAGLFDIPVIYQNATWSKAVSDGHSNGWESIYNHLCSLVEIFENKL